jgi:hypothetical protein
MFTIECQRIAHVDAVGEILDLLDRYDVVTIQAPKLKTWQFSRSSRLIEGYVTPTELVLYCKEVEC